VDRDIEHPRKQVDVDSRSEDGRRTQRGGGVTQAVDTSGDGLAHAGGQFAVTRMGQLDEEEWIAAAALQQLGAAFVADDGAHRIEAEGTEVDDTGTMQGDAA